MSRCFPFPPPGYEGKHRAEDLLELKEVKRKEKKDKKEKRRKDREKKDKDGNSEKRGDKKDRKEKHRGKKEKNRLKKDENREKEEKTRISQDLTVLRKPEERNDKELHLEAHGYDGSNYTGVNKSSLSHNRIGTKRLGYGASQATAKILEELNKRIEEDGEISEDLFCGRGAIMEKDDQGEKAETAVLRNHSMELVGEKGISRYTGVEFRNMDSQLLSDELTGKPLVAPNHVELSGGKVEGTPRAVEHQSFLSVDKRKSNRAHSDKRREELGDRHMKIHETDKDRRNDRKMEENSSIKYRKHELETLKNARITYSSDATSTSHKDGCFSQGAEDAAQSEGNLRKRKDMNSNGFHRDSEVRPYKIQVQTLHHFPENGKKPVASEVFIKTSSDNVALPETIQFHDSSLSMNPTVQPLNVSHPKHNASLKVNCNSRISVDPKGPCHNSGNANEGLNVPMVEDLLAEASRKPTHPDSKYLSRVLRVPDTGQWPECDDQEWLFTKKDPLEKPAQESTMGETHVWSMAVHIESADIYALPYVIPY